MQLEKIIRQAGKNNRKAQAQLYDKFGALWYSICLRYHANIDDAQDALQNALIRIYTKIRQFDPEKGQFKSWSSKIVVNENLMILRKNQKIKMDSPDDMSFDIRDSNHNTAIDILSAKELTKMIMNLPEGYRVVFNMFVIEGYSHEEIAEKLNISVGTSKSQLFKAKKFLRQKLEVLI
jgi:RNA polymerase sigma-70 factor (ECF subfamily)